MNAVFDTNIVIDALNGVAAADTEYSQYERVLISRITWMETLVGAQETDAQVRDFLETQFEIVPLDLAIAERAVQLRRTHHVRLPDAIIWATAQIHDAVLVTRNTKDFHADWEGIHVPYQL
ncbi:MAG: type II toxin-antitoxin system VapC family toxin [Chloroflexi bacterium]|nr:type II toxin-antitoxin system VapC family toxin [Chloroflexota bacterium]